MPLRSMSWPCQPSWRWRIYEAAFTRPISRLDLSPRQMPEHLSEEHKALKEALTWVPVDEPGEGTLRATLRAMSDDEAERIATKFLEIYTNVAWASYGAE
jgi:hypothetical protein